MPRPAADCVARRPAAKIKPEIVNNVWCVDLVFDVTRHSVTLKFLTIVDQAVSRK